MVAGFHELISVWNRVIRIPSHNPSLRTSSAPLAPNQDICGNIPTPGLFPMAEEHWGHIHNASYVASDHSAISGSAPHSEERSRGCRAREGWGWGGEGLGQWRKGGQVGCLVRYAGGLAPINLYPINPLLHGSDCIADSTAPARADSVMISFRPPPANIEVRHRRRQVGMWTGGIAAPTERDLTFGCMEDLSKITNSIDYWRLWRYCHRE